MTSGRPPLSIGSQARSKHSRSTLWHAFNSSASDMRRPSMISTLSLRESRGKVSAHLAAMGGRTMSQTSTVQIREVSDLVTKGTTPTSLGRKFTTSGVRFLKVETFASDGTFIPGREAFIDRQTHQLLRRSQLAEGDILFSIAGALGRSTVVEQAWLPANTNQAFAIIRPSTKRRSVVARYLLWQLRSPAIARRIAEINVQAAQANLSLEQVRDFEIPIVSSLEQEAIADALDDVNELIATLERLIAKKQAIKQGMMQQLLTGRTRLPGFTGTWMVSTLGTLARVTGGRNTFNSRRFVLGGWRYTVVYSRRDQGPGIRSRVIFRAKNHASGPCQLRGNATASGYGVGDFARKYRKLCSCRCSGVHKSGIRLDDPPRIHARHGSCTTGFNNIGRNLNHAPQAVPSLRSAQARYQPFHCVSPILMSRLRSVPRFGT